MIWDKTYDVGFSFFSPFLIRPLNDGGYVAAGAADVQMFVMKIDALGNLLCE
jgi:hypothetical protein